MTFGRCLKKILCVRIRAVIATRTKSLGYWIALSQIPGLGAARFRMLEGHFDGDMTVAWSASRQDLRASGIGGKVAQAIMEGRRSIDPDGELERLERSGVSAFDWNSDQYPWRLKQTADAPPVLYCRGELVASDDVSVAVVGTRRPTDYGGRVTAQLCRDLAERGVVVVSGLALGIDSHAHRATLDAGGRTIAVLGNGLDHVYPRENQRLAERIVAEGGAIVSEFHLGARPEASNFPRRNRIISGMTLGTLITEASETSGTRWTVYHALEQNREIFCVPGSIYSEASKLTNRLIREGAKLVCDVSDILNEIGLDSTARQMQLELTAPEAAVTNQRGSDGGSDDKSAGAPMGTIMNEDRRSNQTIDPEESALLEQVTAEPIHIDDLARLIGRPVAEVSGLLTMLELKGLVEQAGMMHYRLPY